MALGLAHVMHVCTCHCILGQKNGIAAAPCSLLCLYRHLFECSSSSAPALQLFWLGAILLFCFDARSGEYE